MTQEVTIMSSTFVLPVIDEDALEDVVVPEVSAKFVRVQPKGAREFVVSGRKADAIRTLIFADLGLTRKQIALLANASVSRVGEVVWGLQHDAIEFPAIPLRETAPVVEDEDEVVVEDEVV
jgi:hypothetical protein